MPSFNSTRWVRAAIISTESANSSIWADQDERLCILRTISVKFLVKFAACILRWRTLIFYFHKEFAVWENDIDPTNTIRMQTAALQFILKHGWRYETILQCLKRQDSLSFGDTQGLLFLLVSSDEYYTHVAFLAIIACSILLVIQGNWLTAFFSSLSRQKCL